jgi:hypothetical protein
MKAMMIRVVRMQTRNVRSLFVIDSREYRIARLRGQRRRRNYGRLRARIIV